MTFIHKNVNSALLMLIAFISVALVTATVYSVQAFDSVQEKAMKADDLEVQLQEKEAALQALTTNLQQTTQSAEEREQALAGILAKQRQEAAQQQPADSTQTITVPTAPAKAAKATASTYKPYQAIWSGGPWYTKRKGLVI